MAEQGHEDIFSLTFAGVDPGKKAAIIDAIEGVVGEWKERPSTELGTRGPWGQGGGWFRDIQHPWSQSGGWMLVVREGGERVQRDAPVSPEAEALRDVRAALEKASDLLD